MKTVSLALAILSILLLTTQTALAYYSPSTGCWPNRDPLNELGFALLKNGHQAFIVKDLTVKEFTRKLNMLLTEPSRANHYSFVANDPLSKIDAFGLSDWSPDTKKIWKDLLERLKDAWEVSQHGKCPQDPCYSVSSLSAPCHCIFDVLNSIQDEMHITQANINDMVGCICAASSNPDCDTNAKKVIAEVFPPKK